MPKTATKLKTVKNEDTKPLPIDMAKDIGGVAGTRLRAFIERIERMAEEIKGGQDDLKEIYAEAKGVGFDVPTIRRIVRLRKIPKEKQTEQYELLELYKSAIGM